MMENFIEILWYWMLLILVIFSFFLVKHKKRKIYSVYLLIPFVIGAVLFFPSAHNLSFQKEDRTNITTIFIPDYEELAPAGFFNMIRTIFSSPFNLKHYDIFIKDVSIYEGNKELISYLINFSDRTGNRNYGELKSSGKKRIPSILVDEKQILYLQVKMNPIPIKIFERVKTTINFEVKARSNPWDFGTKMIIFILAFDALLLMTKEIVKNGRINES